MLLTTHARQLLGSQPVKLLSVREGAGMASELTRLDSFVAYPLPPR